MWIFLGIIGTLAIIITALLCLPVYVIIKTDANGELVIRYKFFGKVYGDNPSANSSSPIVEALKKAAGLSRLEKKEIKTSAKKVGVLDTLKQDFDLVLDLLKRIVELLKLCVVKKLKLKIVCAKADAADTAISYGAYCAIVNPTLSFVHNFMKVKKRGEDVSISCDYNCKEEIFELDLVVYARVFRLLSTLIKVILKEANRISDIRLSARRKKSALEKTKK